MENAETQQRVIRPLELARIRAEQWAKEDPEYAAVRRFLATQETRRITGQTLARVALIRKRVAR